MRVQNFNFANKTILYTVKNGCGKLCHTNFDSYNKRLSTRVQDITDDSKNYSYYYHL